LLSARLLAVALVMPLSCQRLVPLETLGEIRKGN
jgi:hypothetical protein